VANAAQSSYFVFFKQARQPGRQVERELPVVADGSSVTWWRTARPRRSRLMAGRAGARDGSADCIAAGSVSSMARRVLAHQQRALGGGVRIAQREVHQEAIELRFGQGEGAYLVRRVLGGDDEERLLQWLRRTPALR
jgi:hypothetical protein